MASMWTPGISDLDYYEQFSCREPEQEDRCYVCGAGENEACEEWCTADAYQPDED